MSGSTRMSSHAWRSDLEAEVRALYANAGQAVVDKIESLSRTCARPPRTPFDGPFLVAYPGNVTETGRLHLPALDRLIADWLPDPFPALHLLPFNPSTSDFGFSPVSHLAVDPAFGDWTHVSAFAAKARLIVDLIMHHTSARHPWFRGFLAGQDPYRNFFITADDPGEFALAAGGRNSRPTTWFDTVEGAKLVMTRYGPDQIDLNYRNPGVLIAMLEIMAGLIANGASVLRLDAVAFTWKEPGTACAHLEQAARLLNVMRIAAAAIDPETVIVAEIDAEAHGGLYLKQGGGARVAGYSYAFAPLVIDACLSGDVSALADFLVAEAERTDGSRIIRFLSTHDGLFLRPYAPVLSDAATARLCEAALAAGGAVTRRERDDRVYELNVPVLDLLRGCQPDGEARAAAALFILLSVPGIPAILLNMLVGTPADHATVRRTGDPRAIVRGSLSSDQARDLLSRRAPHIRRWLRLLAHRRSEPALSSGAAMRVLQARNGLLVLLREQAGRKVVAAANVSRSAVSLPPQICGTSMLRSKRGAGSVLEPFECDWILLHE